MKEFLTFVKFLAVVALFFVGIEFIRCGASPAYRTRTILDWQLHHPVVSVQIRTAPETVDLFGVWADDPIRTTKMMIASMAE